MYQIDFDRPIHIHFIGIGGISMSGLAEILLEKGFTVSGSDAKASPLTELLRKKGAAIFIGQKKENLNSDIDLVVYTSAIHSDNPEYIAIQERNLPSLTRAQLLGQIMKTYELPVAVSGTHGKTTTTSMISEILLRAETDPTLSIGGILKSIGGNIRIGHSPFFVTEACEYTNSFLSFFPKVGIILNVEEDHLDFFKDIDDIRLQEIGEMISKRVEVREVKFKSDEEVWEEFQGDYIPEEYRDGFAENPLEGSKNYEIYLSDVSMQSALVTWLESVEGVRQVNRSEITANALGGINVLIGYVSLGIIIILLAVSVFLISNTVMIGISVRKEEINIMKYIGATDFFVRSPFVIEGILIGLLGSVVPLVSIYYLYTNIIVYIGEKFQILSGLLNFLPVEMIFSTLLPVSVGIGVGIGFLGSIVTVRKHLKV